MERMIRLLVKGLVGTAFFVALPHAVAALAAPGPAAPGALGSTNAAISSCQHYPIDLGFHLTPRGDVDAVVLRSLDTSACGGGTVTVSLIDSTGQTLGSATAAVPHAGDQMSVDVAHVDPAAVAAVRVGLVR